jgi:hypothetical protein
MTAVAAVSRRTPVLVIVLVSYLMIAGHLDRHHRAAEDAHGSRLLGHGPLVTVFAAAGSRALDARDLLAHRVATALTAGTVMLALALAVVVAMIVAPREAADVADGAVPA